MIRGMGSLAFLLLILSSSAGVASDSPSCLPAHLKRLLDYAPLDHSIHPNTLGIEFEGTILKWIGKKGAVRTLEKLFRSNPDFKDVTLFHPRSDLWEPHTVSYQYRGRHYTWQIKGDFSVDEGLHKTGNAGRFESIELASPILRDSEDLVTFRRVIRELEKIGVTTNPNFSGIHVHVGFPDPRAQELLVLTDLFSRIESELLDQFSVMPFRRHFAQRTHESLKKAVTDYFPSENALDELMSRIRNHENGRDRALNLQALEVHETVEFRLFNSTIETEHIDVMVDFSSKLISAVRTKDARLLKYLERTPVNELKVMDLARALDMKMADGSAQKVLDTLANEVQTSLPTKVSQHSVDQPTQGQLETMRKGGWFLGLLLAGVSVSATAESQ